MSNQLAVSTTASKDRRPPTLPNFEELLTPDRLVRKHRLAMKAVHWPCMREADPSRALYYRSELEYQQGELSKVLDQGATPAILSDLLNALESALAVPANRNANRALVGLLLDTRTRQPPNPQVYIEALLYDLAEEAFPPAVVAAACQMLRREQVFMPEIAEVLAACRKVLNTFRENHQETLAAVETRDRTERYLLTVTQTLAALPPPEPRTPFDPNAQPGDPGWD